MVPTEMSTSQGCPMTATTLSMGYLGCRGIAFWGDRRPIAGLVAERPKAVKGRNKGGEKEGKKIKGAGQYTCLPVPCKYLITMVRPVSSLMFLLGEGVSVHVDLSASHWKGMMSHRGLHVLGACGWRDQSICVVWVCVSLCDRQQTSSQTSQPAGRVTWEPGTKAAINFDMDTGETVDMLLEIQAGVLVFLF